MTTFYTFIFNGSCALSALCVYLGLNSMIFRNSNKKKFSNYSKLIAFNIEISERFFATKTKLKEYFSSLYRKIKKKKKKSENVAA